MTSINDLAAALRNCTTGLLALEAGVALLISNGTFLYREDFASRFIQHGNSDRTPTAAIDWNAVITALASGDLPCSGGERPILQVSASLAAGIPASARPSPASTTTTPPDCSPRSAPQPEHEPRTADIDSRHPRSRSRSQEPIDLSTLRA
jgi:hypothetical protein